MDPFYERQGEVELPHCSYIFVYYTCQLFSYKTNISVVMAMLSGRVVVVLVIFLMLITQTTNAECPPKGNFTCKFWEKMVSRQGFFLEDSLKCLNYNPKLWSNIVFSINKPQEVLFYLNTVEVLKVDESSKVYLYTYQGGQKT